ncbi:MAG TPA: hypothetical protein VMV55_03970 [Methanoregula sp.]|nr:hypothetical protein [Methanoregulaceae archaeon]HUW86016.1 hypothetical protein [Methanoregula sp.]
METLLWTSKAPVITSRPVVTQQIIVFGISSLFVLALLLLIDIDEGLVAVPYILRIMVFFISSDSSSPPPSSSSRRAGYSATSGGSRNNLP